MNTAAGAIVYVLEADHGVKVGITMHPIELRVRELERASGLHITVVRTWKMRDRKRAYMLEQIAHWVLRDTRTVGEWFQCHPFEACDAIDRIRRHGIPIEYLRRDLATA